MNNYQFFTIIITSSNQRLGSAFYRICSVTMEKWVVWRKAIENHRYAFLTGWADLNWHTWKQGPKPLKKPKGAANLQSSQKNLDFSCLRNAIIIIHLRIPQLTGDTKVLATPHQCIGFSSFHGFSIHHVIWGIKCVFTNCLRHKSPQTEQGILSHNKLTVIFFILQYIISKAY